MDDPKLYMEPLYKIPRDLVSLGEKNELTCSCSFDYSPFMYWK